ncbi:neuroblast differentiation-associated protein AHNAK [Gigaspora margarita]|uniref:Neuroblast differentiation-associated protein AHNAK n=1 Tax=Gigaspora margarita TaxID=4874 RepID=A0A8H3X6U8_GIGMA|nr:neuroblast differentiation-associated protein AHNAK [Gigaspora margarita]
MKVNILINIIVTNTNFYSAINSKEFITLVEFQRFTFGPLEFTSGPLEFTSGLLKFISGPLKFTSGPLKFTFGPLEFTFGPLKFTFGPLEFTSDPLERGQSTKIQNLDKIIENCSKKRSESNNLYKSKSLEEQIYNYSKIEYKNYLAIAFEFELSSNGNSSSYSNDTIQTLSLYYKYKEILLAVLNSNNLS